jgi:hypothetical protein
MIEIIPNGVDSAKQFDVCLRRVPGKINCKKREAILDPELLCIDLPEPCIQFAFPSTGRQTKVLQDCWIEIGTENLVSKNLKRGPGSDERSEVIITFLKLPIQASN